MNNRITVKTTINATIEDVWKLWNASEDIIHGTILQKIGKH